MLVHIYNNFAFSYVKENFNFPKKDLCYHKTLENFIQSLIYANENIKQLYADMSKNYGFDFQQD